MKNGTLHDDEHVWGVRRIDASARQGAEGDYQKNGFIQLREEYSCCCRIKEPRERGGICSSHLVAFTGSVELKGPQ